MSPSQTTPVAPRIVLFDQRGSAPGWSEAELLVVPDAGHAASESGNAGLWSGRPTVLPA